MENHTNVIVHESNNGAINAVASITTDAVSDAPVVNVTRSRSKYKRPVKNAQTKLSETQRRRNKKLAQKLRSKKRKETENALSNATEVMPDDNNDLPALSKKQRRRKEKLARKLQSKIRLQLEYALSNSTKVMPDDQPILSKNEIRQNKQLAQQWDAE